MPQYKNEPEFVMQDGKKYYTGVYKKVEIPDTATVTDGLRAILFLKQKGLCGICERPVHLKPRHRLRMGQHLQGLVDHCHVTGKPRGMLCSSCNLGLGMFKDNRRALLRAAIYIKKGGLNLL